MRKIIANVVCCCLLATPGASVAQNKNNRLIKEIDSLVSARLPAVAPGCVVLVAKGGHIIYKKAFGKANLELKTPMQANMIFRLGSVTKQYTAIAILQLVEQGKISLQDSIQQFIKDFPYKGYTITIENLLTHTSGIMDYQALDTKEANEQFYYRKDFEPKRIIDFFKNEPLAFTPGTKFAYSNSNYFLLGYIIEIVSGKTYREYLQQHIFNVAGLSSTYYGGYKELVPGRVSGYARYNGKFENADYLSMTVPYAAGALMSNADDMFKWHEALYTYKLVKKETLSKAFTPYKLANDSLSGYGYGWFIKNRDGDKSIEHSGGIDGFQSDEIYFPQQDIFIATLYNSLNEGGSDVSFMALDNDIAKLVTGKKLLKEAKGNITLLKQYIGVYEVDPDHQAIVTLENGQLQLQADGGGLPKSPLFEKNEHTFFLKIIDAEIEFVKDRNNNVVQLIVHVNGENQVAKKIK